MLTCARSCRLMLVAASVRAVDVAPVCVFAAFTSGRRTVGFSSFLRARTPVVDVASPSCFRFIATTAAAGFQMTSAATTPLAVTLVSELTAKKRCSLRCSSLLLSCGHSLVLPLYSNATSLRFCLSVHLRRLEQAALSARGDTLPIVSFRCAVLFRRIRANFLICASSASIGCVMLFSLFAVISAFRIALESSFFVGVVVLSAASLLPP